MGLVPVLHIVTPDNYIFVTVIFRNKTEKSFWNETKPLFSACI